MGRRGEGPGEFQRPIGLWLLRGDSLATFDQALRRVTVFTPTGEYARVIQLRGQALNPGVVTFLDDGSFVTSDLLLEIPEQGFAPLYNHLVRWSDSGEFADSLGRHVYAEMGRVGAPENFMVAGGIFAAYTSMTGNLEGYWVGRGEEPDIPMFARDGTMVRRVRWVPGDRAVSAADIESFRSEQLDNVEPERRRLMEERWKDQPVMEMFPAYSRVMATRDHHLWVAQYPRPGRPGLLWLVFDADGRIVGRMETGPRFQPLDGGDGWLLATEPDEFDVEHVRLFRIPTP